MRKLNLNLILLICIIVSSCSSDLQKADIVIQNGLLYDGTGEKPLLGTIAIKDDSILYVGKPKQFNAKKTIDASGKSIAPGFINMLSWGYNSLMKDGFDCNGSLNEILAEDLHFMKMEHQLALLRSLRTSNEFTDCDENRVD